MHRVPALPITFFRRTVGSLFTVLAAGLFTALPAEDGGHNGNGMKPMPPVQVGGGPAATPGGPASAPNAGASTTPAGTPDANGLTIFPFKTAGGRPQAICVGPDGNLWVTEVIKHQIVKVTPTGEVTEFPVPEKNCGVLQGIAAGPDGQIWFTSREENAIRTISVAGKFGASFEIPSAVADYIGKTATKSSWPREIAPGPDGNLWFAEKATDKIAKIDKTGKIVEYALPNPKSEPYCIVTGPDKKIWYTAWGEAKVGCFDPATEKFAEYDAPAGCREVTVGPDGNLWYTGDKGNKIGKMTLTGQVTEYPVPTANAGLVGITAGSDGAVWFCEIKGGKVGRCTLDGKITEIAVPVNNPQPFCLTTGPDKNIWVALQANAVMRVAVTPAAKP
ncbi:MAG TPA: hypothetical protein VL860_13565 [Planctomycetota bacterium]|nr:hypothetical protein [Planctomycetota bacterium]